MSKKKNPTLTPFTPSPSVADALTEIAAHLEAQAFAAAQLSDPLMAERLHFGRDAFQDAAGIASGLHTVERVMAAWTVAQTKAMKKVTDGDA